MILRKSNNLCSFKEKALQSVIICNSPCIGKSSILFYFITLFFIGSLRIYIMHPNPTQLPVPLYSSHTTAAFPYKETPQPNQFKKRKKANIEALYASVFSKLLLSS